jgi:hypothetical protein
MQFSVGYDSHAAQQMMKLINELYEEGVKLYVNNILKIKI